MHAQCCSTLCTHLQNCCWCTATRHSQGAPPIVLLGCQLQASIGSTHATVNEAINGPVRVSSHCAEQTPPLDDANHCTFTGNPSHAGSKRV